MGAITRVLAPNPGPMTLTGTNTWVLGADAGPALVVDPGPEDAVHLDALLAACPAGVGTIVLTHHHHDHVDLVPALVQRTGARVRAVDPDLSDDDPLPDGAELAHPGGRLEVVRVPGHTADSIALLGRAEGVLLTGDTVLGEGPSVIAHPDGDLGDYLTSLVRLQDLVARLGVTRLLPGHGPECDRPGEVLDALLHHREERLRQVRDAVAAGARTADDVVAAVYGGLEPTLAEAARRSAQAQLHHLGLV